MSPPQSLQIWIVISIPVTGPMDLWPENKYKLGINSCTHIYCFHVHHIDDSDDRIRNPLAIENILFRQTVWWIKTILTLPGGPHCIGQGYDQVTFWIASRSLKMSYLSSLLHTTPYSLQRHKPILFGVLVYRTCRSTRNDIAYPSFIVYWYCV